MQFWGFLGERPGTVWQPQRSSWWIRAKTFNWTIIRQFADRAPYITPWFLIPSRRRRGRGARMTRPKGPSLLLFSWLLLRVLNDWTYHRLQLLFDALNNLMETTFEAFSTQTGYCLSFGHASTGCFDLHLAFHNHVHSHSLAVCPTFLNLSVNEWRLR